MTLFLGVGVSRVDVVGGMLYKLSRQLEQMYTHSITHHIIVLCADDLNKKGGFKGAFF